MGDSEGRSPSAMHILLCNERFLFRFGLDRVLILLGRHLHNAGHRITVLANRFDESLEGWSDRVIHVPESSDYLQSNENAASFVASNWNSWFSGERPPDLAIVGGWPFFSIMDLLRDQGVKTVFLDCGAVPLDGYSGGALVVQQKLRDLRRKHLRAASRIVSISRFIADSQSIPDSGGDVPVSVVLLGADHMEASIWSSSAENSRPYLRDRVEQLLREEKPLLLCLGRWEPNTYKNSEAVFPILDGIARQIPHVRALILADPEKTEIPRKYRGRVIPIGFPDDTQLQDLMKRVHLGMIHSRWEGFGLPLAEMQWLGRPVLAFAEGAHPEIAADPRVLCRDNEEMVRKACAMLQGSPAANVPAEAYDRFCQQFRWERVLREWEALIEEIMSDHPKPHLVIDVTCASIDPANTGVIRVTRQLSRALQSQARVSFVRWDPEGQNYVFLMDGEYRQLQQFNGPAPGAEAVISPPGHRIRLEEKLADFSDGPTWLCLTETVQASTLKRVRELTRGYGWQLAAVFYDAIPILHPEFVQDKAVLNNHAAYMRELATCDVVVPISEFSAQCLRDFWRQEGLNGTNVQVDLLAGQLVDPSADGVAGDPLAGPAGCGQGTADSIARMLCVSTIEPRKNHLRLIEACLALKKRRPDLKWQLDLVGNRYAGADDLAKKVTSACKSHPEIRWLGVVDDRTLVDLYRNADFTIYPSIIEGFGVPIVESLAFGTPCLCASSGVMAELAAGGGCLAVEVSSSSAISQGIENLLSDKALLQRLSQQARSRSVRSWANYAADFLQVLAQYGRPKPGAARKPAPVPFTRSQPSSERHDPSGAERLFDIDETLYPGCLCERWPMSHSERMALRALLDHVRPRCAIEVGTDWGGSLSLMAQHAQAVFSIDINPMPPSVRVIPNVSCLTGPSELTLPGLLAELHQQELDPQFILIHGDDSREVVARYLEIILKQPTRCPLWVAVHNSGSRECRAGILDADWAANPRVHFIDVDIVPGRFPESAGSGGLDSWGGLALAILLPNPRAQAIEVRQSAKRMIEALWELPPDSSSCLAESCSRSSHPSKAA